LEIDCIHYDYHDENEEDLRGLDQIEVIFDHCEEEEKKKEIMEGNQENEEKIDENTMEYLLDKYMEYCLDDYPEDQIQTTQEESYHNQNVKRVERTYYYYNNNDDEIPPFEFSDDE
jgi:hypothetical protein